MVAARQHLIHGSDVCGWYVFVATGKHQVANGINTRSQPSRSYYAFRIRFVVHKSNLGYWVCALEERREAMKHPVWFALGLMLAFLSATCEVKTTIYWFSGIVAWALLTIGILRLVRDNLADTSSSR